MLRVEAVDVSIQASQILREVTLQASAGEMVCLVGRNGAGKTTTLRTIMGYLRPASGRILLGGREVTGQPPHALARLGVAYSPEDSGVFADLSVAENVAFGTWTRVGPRPAAERVEEAYALFPRLRAFAGRGGAHLSGGERKMLSIARALALDPAVLLLDEPFEGLAPVVVGSLAAGIAAIAGQGRAVLLAESNVRQVPAGATRLYVIERGEIIYAGPPDGVRRQPAVLAVLGAGT